MRALGATMFCLGLFGAIFAVTLWPSEGCWGWRTRALVPEEQEQLNLRYEIIREGSDFSKAPKPLPDGYVEGMLRLHESMQKEIDEIISRTEPKRLLLVQAPPPSWRFIAFASSAIVASVGAGVISRPRPRESNP